jgi:hypothetical protein
MKPNEQIPVKPLSSSSTHFIPDNNQIALSRLHENKTRPWAQPP